MARGWDAALLQNPVPGDVVKCLNELGIKIRKINEDEVEGYCPAHLERLGKEDRKSKWAVNLETGQHNCFSCGFGGKFVDLVRYVEDCTAEDAVAWIKARGSIDRAKRLLTGGEYIDDLVKTPEVVITEADLALFEMVPEWACAKRDLDPNSVDHYGVLWDPEDELWITPIRDPDTYRLWGWQEKGATHRYFRNHPKHMEKGQTLFGLEQLDGHDTAVLVESPLDCPRLHTAGVEGGISSFGARVTNRQIDLICERVRTLIVALDNDEDGLKGSEHVRRLVRGRVRLKFWNYAGEAKDPGDQTDDEIQASHATAISGVLWRP